MTRPDPPKSTSSLDPASDQALPQSEAIYRTLFETSDQGFCVVELLYDQQGKAIDYRFEEVNSVFERQTGYLGARGKRATELAPNVTQAWIDLVDSVARTGQPLRTEAFFDDPARWYAISMSPLGQAPTPRVASVFDDITDRKRQQQHQAFRATISQELVGLRTVSETMESVSELIGTYFGVKWCVFSELIEDNERSVVSYGWNAPGVVSLKGTYRMRDFLTDEQLASHNAGQVSVVDNSQTDPRVSAQTYGALTIHSFIMVPIARQGQWCFLLSIIHDKARHWQADEVEFMSELTEHIWTRLERARAEEALRQSEGKYRTLFNSIDEGFSLLELIFDQQGHVVDYWHRDNNPTFTRMTGIQDPVGKRMSELVPGLEPEWYHRLEQVYQTGKSIRFDYPVQQLKQWYNCYLSRVEGEGRPFIAAVYDDITGRKAAEAALRQSEEQFRLLTMASSDSIYTMSPDWTQMRQLIGKSFLVNTVQPSASWLETYIPRQEQAHVQQIIQQAIDSKSPFELEHRVMRADGTMGWTFSRAIPMLDEQGTIEQWLGAASDITARKQAEAALHQSEAQQRAILDSAKDYAIFTTDLHQRVTSWNPGAQALFGYSDEAILGQPVDWLYNEPDRQTGIPEQEAKTAIETGRFDNERWHSRQDGSLFYGSGVVTPLRDETGLLIGLLKVMRDLTQQKLAEQALLQADQRKDEFLAMLAHELRNPMATIRSGLQILNLTTGTDAMSVDTVVMMNRQTDHLTRLVDDLLDVSRISQGKIELKKQRVDLVAIARQAVESIRPLYQQQGRSLHVALPADPIHLDGDATRLTQVLTNLLTNGARYTGEQGQVWLSLTHTHKEAILQVRDNGIGVAADQLSAIFELFVQVDNSTARSKGGLGLGLTLVKRLVEMHGGGVDAQSPGLDRGSTFIVHLPTLTTGTESTPKPAPDITDSSTTRRILVVDDNADAAITLAMLLKLKGYEAHTRTSGRAGIDAAEALHPSAILLDLGMPELDGYATCRAIREQAWGQAIVIIALTGYGQAEDRHRTQEAGFNGHLVKPVALDVLLLLLTNLLNLASTPPVSN